MDIYEQIRERHNLDLPQPYRRMAEAGLFSYFGEQTYATLPSAEQRLQLIRRRVLNGELLYLRYVEWLSPQEILAFDPGTWTGGLVPFAGNGAGDYWCWYLPWSYGGEAAVVYYDHELWRVTGSARDFTAWLFGAILQECTDFDCSLFRPEEVGEVLDKYARLIAPDVPEEWYRVLQALSSRPVQTRGESCYMLEDEEYQAMVRRYLAFPYLDATIDVWA